MDNSPLLNFHFQVDLGDSIAGFSEVSGLRAEHEILEYRSGSDKEYSTHKIPGLKKFSNLVLKRGVLKGDIDIFSWFNNVGLAVERRQVTITLLDHNHEPTMIWIVKNAWPVRFTFSELNALRSEILIESLELAHEGIVVESK